MRAIISLAALFAVCVVAATTASAVTLPDAGGDRMVDEDASTSFTGTDSSSTAVTEGWVFDGMIVDGNPASWMFDTPGVYSASYWADDGAGSNVSDTVSISVRDITAPVADAGSDIVGDEDSPVTFDASASTDNDPNFASSGRYYWLFMMGGTSISLNGASPSYTFNTPGTYSVTLLVLDMAGNYGSDVVMVTVSDVTDPSAVVVGGLSQSADEDSPFSFDATGSSDNDPSFSSTGTYSWSFTDGSAQTLSGMSASYTFAEPGSYTVTLTVTDAAGNEMTAVLALDVLDITAPTVDWTIATGMMFDEDVEQTLDGTSSTDNVGVVSFSWTINHDGGPTVDTSSSLDFTWDSPGTYDVTLTVYDAAGNAGTLTQAVMVIDLYGPTSVVITGGTPQEYDEDVAVTLDASSSLDNDPAFLTTGTFEWAISGPVSDTVWGSSTTYTFATPGTYTVTLTATDTGGNSGQDSITIEILDVTAPDVMITSGTPSVERFYSANPGIEGMADDNVGVASSGWDFVENSVSQSVAGDSLDWAWPYTGTYTLTYWAMDEAGNIATTSMILVVSPDVTPPVISILGQSIAADTLPVDLTASIVSELDPSCASACTYAWSVTDRFGTITALSATTATLSYTFAAGHNVVEVVVTDPSGNQGTATKNVDVSQTISVSTVWTTSPLVLDWDVAITNGATLTIRNTVIQEPTIVPLVTFLVSNGRLIFENSQLGVSGATYGAFRLRGIPDTTVTNPVVAMFFNNSQIRGTTDVIDVRMGVVSATGSTFSELRPGARGIFLGTDTSFFFNNVQMDSTSISNAYGVRADFTTSMVAGTSGELRLDQVSIASNGHSADLRTTSVVNNINVLMRDVTLRTVSSSFRGFNVLANGGGSAYTFTMTRVNAVQSPGGAIESLFNNRIVATESWAFTDSNFSKATTGVAGISFRHENSMVNCMFSFSNVSLTENRRGMQWTFRNTLGGAPTTVVDNGCDVTMDNVLIERNTQSGMYVERTQQSTSNTYVNFLRFNVTITQSKIVQNTLHGMQFLLTYGYPTTPPWNNSVNLTLILTDVELARNVQAGLFMDMQYVRVEGIFRFTRVQIDNNTNYGVYHNHNYSPQTIGFGGLGKIATYGYSFVDSKITSSNYGLYINNNYLVGQQNYTFNLLRSSIAFNRQYGAYLYTNQFVYYPSSNYTTTTNKYWFVMDDSSASNNRGSYAIYMYTYYCYGSSGGECNVQLVLNNSHVDNNTATGLYFYVYYFQYMNTFAWLKLTNGSTVDRNGGQGIYYYCYYCAYDQGSRVSMWRMYIRDNSSVSYNGGEGIYINYQQHSNTGAPSGLDIDGGKFIRNGRDGIWFYNYYIDYSATLPVYNTIKNSTFKENIGIAYRFYYYQGNYYYSCGNGITPPVCANETVEGNTFENNQGGDMLLGYATDYFRSRGRWDFNYINNTFISPKQPVLKTLITYTYYYSGTYTPAYGQIFNFSGNKVFNASGSPLDFGMDSVGKFGSGMEVIFKDNYFADAGDAVIITMPGRDGGNQNWIVANNTFVRGAAGGLKLISPNIGPGNTGNMTFENNVFIEMGGSALVIEQTNMKMQKSVIKNSVFINTRKAMELKNLEIVVDNVTIQGSLQADIELTDGIVEIHNTPVDPTRLVTLGKAASFNVYFHLKVFVKWFGSEETAFGSIVEISDALGVTFFVGTINDESGVPELELWSYSKSTQGVLGRSPFRALVSLFEVTTLSVIELPEDRVVNVYLRDEVMPTLVVARPAPDFGTRDPRILVEGTAYDAESGFKVNLDNNQFASKYVQVSVDGTTWNPAHIKVSDFFKIQFDYLFTGLDQSVDTVYVRVRDEAGNTLVREIPVVVDWTPPVVTLLEEVPSITNEQTVRVVGETEVGAEVLVNGRAPEEVFTRPDGVHVYFEMTVPLLEGPNTVVVMAIDRLDNTGSASFFVLVDLKAPFLQLIEPAFDALINTNSAQLVGQASDRNGVSVTVNGASVDIVDGEFTMEMPLIGEFTRIEVVATDAAGNVERIIRDLRLDQSPPWIDIQSPAPFAVLGNVEVRVTGVVEPGSELLINDQYVETPTGSFSRVLLLREGANNIRFVAIDRAGNVWEETRTVTIDAAKPMMVIRSPLEGALWSRSTITVDGKVSDDHGVSVFIEGAEVAVRADGNFTLPVVLLEGTNIITVEARDSAGNAEIREISVIRDTTAPLIMPVLEGTYFDGVATKTNHQSLTVFGMAERGSAVEVCLVSESGAETCNALPLSAAGEFRSFVDLKADARNELILRATDPAGNPATRTFTVFHESPVVAVESVVSGATVGMFGVALAALGVGAYLLVFARRGRGGRGTEPVMAEPAGHDGGEVALSAAPEVADAGAVAESHNVVEETKEG